MGFADQARFLKRQLSSPVSTMSQWWVRRSRSAVVILASPNTLGHSPNARFEFGMTVRLGIGDALVQQPAIQLVVAFDPKPWEKNRSCT